MKNTLFLCCFTLLALWGHAANVLNGSGGGEAPMEPAQVTFCVDLSCFSAVDAASVGGTFNNFNFGADFLTDQGDGLYCVTKMLETGTYEYRFFFAQEQQENLDPVEDGACTTSGANGVARVIDVISGVNQTVTFGWETCESECEVATTTDVELCVDLSCFAQVDAAAVAGTFNSFNPGTDFLSNQGNGIYCATVPMEAGEQEFLFFFAQEQFEDMDPTEDAACTTTNFGFTNRVITVVEGQPASYTYGWETCATEATCPTTTDIELCVDLSCFPQVDAAAVAGQFNGFSPTEFLTNQGNGVYCTTVGLPSGPQEFKFFFAQEQFENFGPEDAACTANGNRLINVVEGQPETYTFGWERCDDQCIIPGANVNFCVNVGCTDLDPNSVNIFGQFNGFNPAANPMTNQGDGLWCTTVFLPPGNQEYLFLADGVAEQFPAFGGGCTITCCDGAFTNRLITIVDGQDQTVNFDWEECTYTPPEEIWSYDDVTANGGSGEADFSPCDVASAPITIDYTATNLNNAVDNHGFVHNTLCGDGEISFRVVDVSSGAYVGPTMRETTAAGAKQVSMFSNMTNVLRWEFRSFSNGPTTVQAYYKPFPMWLKLIRQGDWVFGYYSNNGSTYNYVHAVNVPMGTCIEAGVSLWSYLPFVPASGTVDNVNVIEYGNNSSIAIQGAPGNVSVARNWEVFPNPAVSTISLRWNSEVAPTQMTIYNGNGQIVRSQPLDAGLNSLDLQIDDLTTGAYWIEMRNEQQRLKTLPFVKQ